VNTAHGTAHTVGSTENTGITGLTGTTRIAGITDICGGVMSTIVRGAGFTSGHRTADDDTRWPRRHGGHGGGRRGGH
jgi:hypothetical protein